MIIDFVEGQGITDKDELIAILENKIDIPDYELLVERYIASIANRIVATVKDSRGRRCILAKRGTDGTKYVNLNKCSDLKVLKEIKSRIQKEIDGRHNSLNMVDLKITAVQMNIFTVLDGQKKAN